jgi:hypothetical protein
MALPKGFKRVGVDLPPSVIKIIRAAGGEDNFPRAMAGIVGSLPWIAAALYDSLPEDEYRAFAAAMRPNYEKVMQIVDSDNPRKAFNEELERQKRAVS